MNIKIFYDDIKYRLRRSRQARKIIATIIESEDFIPGELNYIFTNNSSLRKINVQFLEHDFNTDVITFDYREGKIINGEIYISIETVKDNANNYKVSLRTEVLRVMIHGVLHLMNYDDKSDSDRRVMREKEEIYLRLFEE